MFNIETNVSIPSSRGAYDFSAFSAPGMSAFIAATDRSKKAASLRASARRCTVETGVQFVVRAVTEKNPETGADVDGVRIWRVN